MIAALPPVLSATAWPSSRLIAADRHRHDSRRRRRRCCSRLREDAPAHAGRSAAVALVVGGVVMLVVGALGTARRDEDARRRAGDALRVGVAQALALIPGVSRSGVDDRRSRCCSASTRGRRRGSRSCSAIPAIARRGGKEALDLRSAASRRRRARCSPSAADVGRRGLPDDQYFLRFLAGHRLDVFAASPRACGRDVRLLFGEPASTADSTSTPTLTCRLATADSRLRDCAADST